MLWMLQEASPEGGNVETQVTEAADDAAAAVEGAEGGEAAGSSLNLTDGVSSDEMMTLWTDYGLPTVKAIILIIAVLIISKWVGGMITRICRKSNVDETLARFFGNMGKYAIMVLGGLAVLSTFGIDTTSFAAVIAAAGFAVGMAMSGLLGNFAAGIMLLIFRPFKIGDVVSAGGVTAKVEAIELFTTVFTTPDNRKIIVPNGDIYGGTIENITHHDTRRVDVAVGTDYSADLDKTREVLMGAAKKIEGVLGDPEPVIYLSELGGSSIDWSVRVWAATADYWAVREKLTRQVKYDLDEAGIGIPFPQMDVHIDGAVNRD
ncbi:MAG: mechanosensitive ion channel family protein [Phycisphaera sp.]|nr:MAG: mechanosensitive ion channel family protein [Phycisphaera sp.]